MPAEIGKARRVSDSRQHSETANLPARGKNAGLRFMCAAPFPGCRAITETPALYQQFLHLAPQPLAASAGAWPSPRAPAPAHGLSNRARTPGCGLRFLIRRGGRRLRCEILHSRRGTAPITGPYLITPSVLDGCRVCMISILVIGGLAVVVALSLAAAIAPRTRPLVTAVRPWPFEEHGHPVERSGIPRDDLA
jgi:hypothetical protein